VPCLRQLEEQEHRSMTDTSTAVEVAPSAGLAQVDNDPERRRLNALYKECQRLATSDLVPKALRGKPDNVFALARFGEEFGLPPVHAIQRIYIIEGSFEPKAEVLAGVIMRAGHELRWEETSSEKCTVAIRRAGTDYWQRVTWTIEDARRAGLLDEWVERWVSTGDRNRKEMFVLGSAATPPEWAKRLIDAGQVKRKDPWWQFPDDMLAAKTLRRAAKRICPDALLSLADVDDVPVERYLPGGSAAELDEEPAHGEVVDEQPFDTPDDDDDDVVDGEVIDGDKPADAPAEQPPLEDPADAGDEIKNEHREKLQRQLMATATKTFPKDSSLLPAQQRARVTAQRHAVAFVALGEHKSANDMTEQELGKVLARLDDVQQGRLRVEDRDGSWWAVQGDRELPIPAETVS
jgi:hypothetical protein